MGLTQSVEGFINGSSAQREKKQHKHSPVGLRGTHWSVGGETDMARNGGQLLGAEDLSYNHKDLTAVKPMRLEKEVDPPMKLQPRLTP